MGMESIGGVPVGMVPENELKLFQKAGLDINCVHYEGNSIIPKRKSFEFIYDTNDIILDCPRLKTQQIFSIANTAATGYMNASSYGGHEVPDAVFKQTIMNFYYHPLCVEFNEDFYNRAIYDPVKLPIITSNNNLINAIAPGYNILLSGDWKKSKYECYNGDIIRMPDIPYQLPYTPFIKAIAPGFHQTKIWLLYPFIILDDCLNSKLLVAKDPKSLVLNYCKDIGIGATLMSFGDRPTKKSLDYLSIDHFQTEMLTGACGNDPYSTYSMRGEYDFDKWDDIMLDTHISDGVKIHHNAFNDKHQDYLTTDYFYRNSYYHHSIASHLIFDKGDRRQIRRHQWPSELEYEHVQSQQDGENNPPKCGECNYNHITHNDECYHIFITMDQLLFILHKLLRCSTIYKASKIMTREVILPAIDKVIDENGGKTIYEINHALSALGVVVGYKVSPISGDDNDEPRMVNLNEEIVDFQWYKEHKVSSNNRIVTRMIREGNVPSTPEYSPEYSSPATPSDMSEASNLSESSSDDEQNYDQSPPTPPHQSQFNTNALFPRPYTHGPQKGMTRAVPGTPFSFYDSDTVNQIIQSSVSHVPPQPKSYYTPSSSPISTNAPFPTTTEPSPSSLLPTKPSSSPTSTAPLSTNNQTSSSLLNSSPTKRKRAHEEIENDYDWDQSSPPLKRQRLSIEETKEDQQHNHNHPPSESSDNIKDYDSSDSENEVIAQTFDKIFVTSSEDTGLSWDDVFNASIKRKKDKKFTKRKENIENYQRELGIGRNHKSSSEQKLDDKDDEIILESLRMEVIPFKPQQQPLPDLEREAAEFIESDTIQNVIIESLTELKRNNLKSINEKEELSQDNEN